MSKQSVDRRRVSCAGCRYWKKISTSGGSLYACHFSLEQHRTRRRDGTGRCKEFDKKTLAKCGEGALSLCKPISEQKAVDP